MEEPRKLEVEMVDEKLVVMGHAPTTVWIFATVSVLELSPSLLLLD